MAKTDTDIRFEIVKTNKSLLGTTDISNGCVYFVDDTKELFFDFDSKRSEVKDILVLEKESERTSILFVPLNKFYFILETKILWFYKDGTWYQVSQSTPPSTDPSSITIADLSKISTGLSISAIDNKIVVSSGHVVDSTATKVLKLDSPIVKTLSIFAEGNGNGAISSIVGDLIPILTSNTDNIIYRNTNVDYLYVAFDGINDYYSGGVRVLNNFLNEEETDYLDNYLGWDFKHVLPSGKYTIDLYINGFNKQSWFSITIITADGSEIEIVSLTKTGYNSIEHFNYEINIKYPFTAIKVNTPKAGATIDGITNISNGIVLHELQIKAPATSVLAVNIIAKDDNTTDICIGNNIPNGFTYNKQIGKIILNEDSTQIVDFLPKIDLATLYVNDELALKSDIPTDYVTQDDIKTIVNITYSELVDLKNNNNLLAGVSYRIIDYVTTTNGTTTDSAEPSRSAGHPFDIIVRAISENQLSEVASCALHEGDTYFANRNLSAWQVWYDINNDTTKYTWADAENGKGVIYRMIDENQNDLPYDFKNIQFYRGKTLAKYSNFADRMTAEDGYYYTFCDTTTSPVSDYSITSAKGIYNTTMGVDSLKVPKLNNILFLFNSSYKYASNVSIGQGTYNCTFAYAMTVDIKGQGTYNLYLAGGLNGVTIGGGCHDISSQNIYNSYFGTACYNITVGQNITSSKLSDYNKNITIGNNCYDIELGIYANYVNIGNNCESCIFDYYPYYLNIGDYNRYIRVRPYVRAVNTPSGTSSAPFQNYVLNYGLRGKNPTTPLDLTGLAMGNKPFPTDVKLNSDGKVLALWNNLGTTVGKYKDSYTATEWKNIIPEYYTIAEIDAKLGDISTILDSLNGEVQ